MPPTSLFPTNILLFVLLCIGVEGLNFFPWTGSAIDEPPGAVNVREATPVSCLWESHGHMLTMSSSRFDLFSAWQLQQAELPAGLALSIRQAGVMDIPEYCLVLGPWDQGK